MNKIFIILLTINLMACTNAEKETRPIDKLSKTFLDSIPAETDIGEQVWQTRNLSTTSFRNGDHIPKCFNHEQWKKAYDNKQPACCSYDFNYINDDTYGLYYNCYAVQDIRNLAPAGFRVPILEDWHELMSFLGGQIITEKLCAGGPKLWKNCSYDCNNEAGFFAFPSAKYFGDWNTSQAEFGSIGTYACWWCMRSTKSFETWPSVSINSGSNAMQDDIWYLDNYIGCSVRCLKGEPLGFIAYWQKKEEKKVLLGSYEIPKQNCKSKYNHDDVLRIIFEHIRTKRKDLLTEAYLFSGHKISSIGDKTCNVSLFYSRPTSEDTSGLDPNFILKIQIKLYKDCTFDIEIVREVDDSLLLE